MPEIDALLPPWVRWLHVAWLPVTAFAVAAGGTWCASHVAARVAGPLPAGSWAARARITYPVRAAAGTTVPFLALVFVLLALAIEEPLTVLPAGVFPWLVGVAAVEGGWLAAHRETCRLGVPAVVGTSGLMEVPSTLLLMCPVAVLGPLVLTVGAIGSTGAALAVLMASLLLLPWLAMGGGLRLLAALGVVRPASARLARVAAAAAARVRLAPREVVELRLGMANAIAFPLGRRIAVTSAALAALDDAELTAVCAHELGHLSETRAVGLARLVPIAFLLLLAAAPAIVRVVHPLAVGAGFVGLLVVLRLAGRLRGGLEARADAVGRAHEPEAGAYSRALERLYEASGVPAVMPGTGGPHGQLYDRLVAAGVTPSYPRPAPPSNAPIGRGVAAGLGVAIVVLGALLLPVRLRARATDAGERAVLWQIALTGGAAPDYRRLAVLAQADGHRGRSLLLEEVATAVAPAGESVARAGRDDTGGVRPVVAR